jgi:hypothetical protein
MGYKVISDAATADGQLFTIDLLTNFRDNYLALFNGDLSTPNSDRIKPTAIRPSTAVGTVYKVFEHTVNALDDITTSEVTFITVLAPYVGGVTPKLTVDYTLPSPGSGGFDTDITMKFAYEAGSPFSQSSTQTMSVNTSGTLTFTPTTITLNDNDTREMEFILSISAANPIDSLTLTAELFNNEPLDFAEE